MAELEPESSPAASTSAEPGPSPSISEASTSLPSDAPVPLSKNAQKKLAKQAAFEALKPLRRAKERAMKKEKAKEKRKLVELGVIEKQPNKKLLKQVPKKVFNARIVIDLGFDELMGDKDIKSMASQVAYCYAANRKTPTPVPILVTSLNGQLKAKLDAAQKTYQSWRDIEWWEEGYESLWSGEEASSSSETPPIADAAEASIPPSTESDPSIPTPLSTSLPSSSSASSPIELGTLAGQPKSRTPRSSVVYLTGDSNDILEEFEEGTTYVLGGIVDHNRYKNLCLDKAEKQGIRHAQLPISKYLPEMLQRRILTVNQVFEIIVKWIELRDWEAALRAVMPTRKYVEGGKASKHQEKNEEGSTVAVEDEEAEAEGGENGEEEAVYVAEDEEEVEAP